MSGPLQLPPVRGSVEYGRKLAGLSWLRVGGSAEVLFQPGDDADLASFLASLPGEVPVMAIGVCSNLLIRDGGVDGVVIRLGRKFGTVCIEDGRIVAGAAALSSRVALQAASAGIDVAFLRTIPGTLGGAVKMNAGCYGRYLADIFLSARAVTRSGTEVVLDADRLAFAYRSSALPDDWILTRVELDAPRRDPEEVRRDMEAFVERRARTQPVEARSCGSVFRNPSGHSSTGRADDVHDLKAWRLIEKAGMRGARLGGAAVSDLHANFLVNTGTATAADLETLGETVRKKVLQDSGVELQWEIRRVGKPAPETDAGNHGRHGGT